MGKFNYNNKIYEEFGNFDFGKRVYLLIKNESDLKYIYTEMIDGKKVYKMPSNDYSLEANGGKSLKQLNERILVDHALSILKDDLSNLELNVEKMKHIITNYDIVSLLKGNLSEITIESFEKNKEMLINKFDEFYGINKPVFDIKEPIEETIVMNPVKKDYPELSRLAKNENQFTDNNLVENSNNNYLDRLNERFNQNNVTEPNENDFEPKDMEKDDLFSKTDNPIGVNELELDLNTVDSMLENKDKLNDNQANYLEGLQTKLANDLETKKENEIKPKTKSLGEYPKQKKSGFVDVVIVCLGIQLFLFVGLICVMLFIK